MSGAEKVDQQLNTRLTESENMGLIKVLSSKSFDFSGRGGLRSFIVESTRVFSDPSFLEFYSEYQIKQIRRRGVFQGRKDV